MTFAKKGTRTVSVQGKQYLWHLNPKFEMRNHWIVIQQKPYSGQLLCLDTYSHDLAIGPRSVVKAIQFALENGWEPKKKTAPMYLQHENGRFSITKQESQKGIDEAD